MARYGAAIANKIRARGVPAIWGVFDSKTFQWHTRPDPDSPTGVRRVEFADRDGADALAARLNQESK